MSWLRSKQSNFVFTVPILVEGTNHFKITIKIIHLLKKKKHFVYLHAVRESLSPAQSPLSPVHNHLNTDHPHLQPAIKHSLNTRFTQTLIVLTHSVLTFMCFPSDPPDLLRFLLLSSCTIPIHLQRMILQSSQIRTKELPLVFLLTSSPYQLSHSTNQSINSLCIH